MTVGIVKIEEYNLNKETKALALSLKVKAMFKNSTIFNYSLPKLVKLTGLSYGTSKKYLNVLLKHDDAIILNGNLTFKRIREDGYNFNEDVLRHYGNKQVAKMSIPQIEKLLQLAILKHKGKQQLHTVERFNASIDPKTYKQAKARARLIKKTGVTPTGKRKAEQITFSLETICKILNKSKDYVCKLIKFLCETGLLGKQPRFDICPNFGNKTDMYRLNESCEHGAYIRTKAGIVYLSQSNLYFFSGINL